MRKRKPSDYEQRIAEYRAEVEHDRAQFERWLARNAEAKAIRDKEPISTCAKCGSEMRQGDYHCHVCATPNPEYAPRAVEFVLWGDA